LLTCLLSPFCSPFSRLLPPTRRHAGDGLLGRPARVLLNFILLSPTFL
jgi:hypothetical protein